MKYFDLTPVPKAKNLDCIGWTDGYMLVRFRGKPDRWLYGPNIAEVEKEKILRVPFPDRQFTQAIKAKYQCHKIGSK